MPRSIQMIRPNSCVFIITYLLWYWYTGFFPRFCFLFSLICDCLQRRLQNEKVDIRSRRQRQMEQSLIREQDGANAFFFARDSRSPIRLIVGVVLGCSAVLLLGCWVVGLLGCWVVGLLGCLFVHLFLAYCLITFLKWHRVWATARRTFGYWKRSGLYNYYENTYFTWDKVTGGFESKFL